MIYNKNNNFEGFMDVLTEDQNLGDYKAIINSTNQVKFLNPLISDSNETYFLGEQGGNTLTDILRDIYSQIVINTNDINDKTNSLQTIKNSIDGINEQITNINNDSIPKIQDNLSTNVNVLNNLNNTIIPAINTNLISNKNTLDTILNEIIPSLDTNITSNASEINVIKNTTIPNINTSINQQDDSINSSNLLINNAKNIAYSMLPIGSIIAWNNLNVPTGWAICDGTNGTPNLSGRFIMGYGGKYLNIGSTGGSETVTLNQSNFGLTNTFVASANYNNIQSIGTNNISFNILPPYYVLLYIMKISNPIV